MLYRRRLQKLVQHLSTRYSAVGAVRPDLSLGNKENKPSSLIFSHRYVHSKKMADEIAHSREAAAKKMEDAADRGESTIFDKIVNKEIPCSFIYEDEKCVAFHDLNPQGPVHFLVIPKDRQGLSRLSKATESHKELLGHLLYVSQHVAKQQGLTPGGFRLISK